MTPAATFPFHPAMTRLSLDRAASVGPLTLTPWLARLAVSLVASLTLTPPAAPAPAGRRDMNPTQSG